MLVLTIFAMLCLTLTMYFVSRNLLFPPVIFTGVWLVSLVGLWLAGDMFYEVRGMAFLVYLVGAIAFSIGGILGLHLFQGDSSHAQTRLPNIDSTRAIHRFLDILLIILVAALPLYWGQISSVADDVSTDLLLQNIRYKQVEASAEGGSFSLINNLNIVAQFLALVMFIEADGSRGRRWRAIFAAVLAVVYGGMAGTKGGVVILLLTFYFIYAIKNHRLRVLPLLATIGVAIAAFAVGLVVVNLAVESYTGAGAMFSAISELILNYWLGGIVAFQGIVENQNAIESTQPIYRFFLETARSLGMGIEVPSIHADYTAISPSMNTNTYTIYFTYFKDYGWFGTVFFMLMLGMGLTFCYKRAMQGRAVAILFYAMLLVGLALSFHSEHFFLGLNGYIKALIFTFVVYRIVPVMARGRFWKTARHV